MQSDYDRVGGRDGLVQLVTRFIDRVFDDMIIGFHFVGRDRARIITHEVEHASRVLGGPLAYTGKPLGPSHKRLKINQGQFRRRLALLRTVLREEEVDEDIITRWLDHDRRLMSVITDGTDCVGESPPR